MTKINVSSIPNSVGITRRERDVLWQHASFLTEQQAERLHEAFRQFHPSPANYEQSKAPSMKTVDRIFHRLDLSILFFESVGWEQFGQQSSYTIRRDLIPFVRWLMKDAVKELRDHDDKGRIIPKAKDATLDASDYHPEGERKRELEDELLEIVHMGWQVLWRFGITGPLKNVPKAVPAPEKGDDR